MVKKAASRIYLAVIFLFLYLPILVLVVLSFNNSKSRVGRYKNKKMTAR